MISGRKLLVVGVLAEDDSMMAAMSSANAVYVPFTVAERLRRSSSASSGAP
jgi:hypothetical protein